MASAQQFTAQASYLWCNSNKSQHQENSQNLFCIRFRQIFYTISAILFSMKPALSKIRHLYFGLSLNIIEPQVWLRSAQDVKPSSWQDTDRSWTGKPHDGEVLLSIGVTLTFSAPFYPNICQCAHSLIKKILTKMNFNVYQKILASCKSYK